MSVWLRKTVFGLVLAGAGLALSGCSLFETDDATNDLNKEAAQYQERPVEQIYADAWTQIDRQNWLERLESVPI